MSAALESMVDAGPLPSVPEGGVVGLVVDGVSVALVRWRDELFALRDVCPHQQGQVCRGFVRPVLESEEVGEAAVDRERGVIICPWHRWEYDLRTGVGLRRERFRLRTYRVEVVDGRLYIDLGRRG